MVFWTKSKLLKRYRNLVISLWYNYSESVMSKAYKVKNVDLMDFITL